MRNLVLLRGAPGAGKSSFLRVNNLEQYSLCADNIRMLFQGPVMGLDGKPQISQKNDKDVWEFLFKLLDKRMSRGEFTLIDATHQKTDQINAYKALCQKYRYRCYVVDFTSVPEATCIAQNLMRPEYKQVPEKVIQNAYARFKSQPVPGWVTVIKPEQYQQTFRYEPTDYSHYEKIHIIGDIQGCYTVLREYLTGDLNPNHLYIFVGDWLDRGIENAEVLQYILTIYNLPNVILLEGNHEKHIRDWANDEPIAANEFIYNTKPQLEAANIDKKIVRELCRKIAQICYFTYYDKAVMVTHGGIATMPENLLYIATEQFIKGVGRYEDDIDNIFTQNANRHLYVRDTGKMAILPECSKFSSNVYQVHGHRNILGLPVQAAPRSFNLEGKVEFGGHLRVVTLDVSGFETHEIKNTVYKKQVPKIDTVPGGMQLLEALRASKQVDEKQFGNISSFNFSRDTFDKKKWTAEATKARGLFINTDTREIVARSYDKFFNVNETETTKVSNLENVLQFPVDVYHKYNGFLGITGHDNQSDKLVIASKSSLQGPFQEWFSELVHDQFGDQVDDFTHLLKKHELSGIFEVIDPVRDPHIVEYPAAKIVLIDLVYRRELYEKMPYHNMKGIAKSYNLEYKQHVERLDNWQDFYKWYERVVSDETIQEEGYVIEDAAGFMTKIKLPWYNHWKHMRSIKDLVARSSTPMIRGGSLTTPQANEFYAWLKAQDKDYLKSSDIIKLRKEFECRSKT